MNSLLPCGSHMHTREADAGQSANLCGTKSERCREVMVFPSLARKCSFKMKSYVEPQYLFTRGEKKVNLIKFGAQGQQLITSHCPSPCRPFVDS